MQNAAKNSDEKVCVFRIVLEGIEPEIWRRVLIPDAFTLTKVHTIIQAVMGWRDYHLHEFSIGELTYGRPDYHEGPGLLDERKVCLRDFDLSPGDRIGYLYDFGDDWAHLLILEEKQALREDVRYPVCVTGEFAGPPEDVGGCYGYERFLEVISDPGHEEHQVMLEWIGGGFDPEAFDVDQVNKRLHRRFQLRKKR
jgi:hypothetical protein